MKPILSRRQFITTAVAAAAAGPLILRSGLRAADAPSNHVRLAAIGCGSRARWNVLTQFVPELPDARVVAACDCFTHKREDFARQVNAYHGMNVCTPLADFREVLARSDIDGVIISTQDHWHVPLAYLAIAAGKAVYVEKPLSIAVKWAQKLRTLALQKNAVFQYGTQQRGDQPQFRRACELVRNGHLGEVKQVLAWCPGMEQQFGQAAVSPYGSTTPVAAPPGFDYDMWLGPAPMKPFTVDRCTNLGGFHIYDYALGFIAGWGAHPLDIMQWGLDLDHTGPTQVVGTGKLPPTGSLWDSLERWDATYRYANGVEVRLMTDTIAKAVAGPISRVFHDHGTLFLGRKGWILVDRLGLYASTPELQKQETTESELKLTRTASHRRNFVDAIRRKEAAISPLESAIRSDTLSHLADIAIRTGRELRWDPETETILGDPEAAQMLDRPARAEWNLLPA